MLKRMQGKRNSYSLLMEKQTGTLVIEISFLQKGENRSTTGPNFTILGHTPKTLHIYQRDTCSSTFTFLLFIRTGNCKQSRCPSIEGWVIKYDNQKTEYYSSVKTVILKFTDKWIELEITILSEVTYTQKDRHGVFPLISGYQL